MAATRFPTHAVLAQQTEITRDKSPAQIKRLIVESDSRVASLQNEIAALESQIAALVELRDRECAAGDALRFLIAPIRTLPAELLAEIFVLTIREPDSNEFVLLKNSLHVRDAFRVSHVCHQWRQVANGTPQLWTGPIHLLFKDDSEKEEIFAIGLRAWLARSEPLSLPISIEARPDSSSLNERRFRPMEELIRVASRLRSLRFVSASGAPSSLIQRLSNSRLDSLEELELQNIILETLDFDPKSILAFKTAPRLRKLSIGSDPTSKIPMPWAQLTDITLLGAISPSLFLDIFAQCKNVVKASVIVLGWSLNPPPRNVVLALDHLRILSVRWFGTVVRDMLFLDCLSAPALDDLHMVFHLGGSLVWAETTFTAFQRRSPNITKLRIEGNGFTPPPGALVTALRHAPSLTHLALEECPNFINRAFLDALRYADNAEPLVPCLHSLALAGIDGNLSEDGLAGMIKSRWWTDAELVSRSRVPAVSRWRQIRFRDDWMYSWSSRYSSFKPSAKFRDTLEDLRRTGLAADFVEYDSWDCCW
ncbi:hypothetical protein C8R45DRAFT_1124717 [Mycena sanguinolenta]|nr:hypothetical protein C8R45DRAFT_1124717 [Mycena sanguinolenta]